MVGFEFATTHRVLRGASWEHFSPDFLLSSYRSTYFAPDSRLNLIGFRCVLVGGSGG